MPKKRFRKKDGFTFTLSASSGRSFNTAIPEQKIELRDDIQDFEADEEIEDIEEDFSSSRVETEDPQRYLLGEYGFKDDGYNYLQHFKPIGESNNGVYFSKNDFLTMKQKNKEAFEKNKAQMSLPFIRTDRESALEKETKKEEKKDDANTIVSVVIQDSADEKRFRTYENIDNLDSDVKKFLIEEDNEIPSEDQMEDDFIIKMLKEDEDEDEEIEEFEDFEEIDEEDLLSDTQKDVERSILEERFDREIDSFVAEDSDSENETNVNGIKSKDIEDELFDEMLSMRLLQKYKTADKIDQFLNDPNNKNRERFAKALETDNLNEITEEMKNDILRLVSQIENKNDYELVEVEEPEEEEKWDCESIISTYTNTENHPTLISKPQTMEQKKRIMLSRRTGMPIKDQPPKPKVEQKEETENLGKSRNKTETLEEKKERKNAIKNAKKDRRLQKKNQKVAFTKESIRIQKTVAGQVSQAQTSVYY